MRLSHPGAATSGPFLNLLRELCPEAVPIRFGNVEPLEYRLPENDALFEDLWRKSNQNQSKKALMLGTLFFTAKTPCFGGAVSFSPRLHGTGEKPEEQFVRLALRFDRGVLNDNPNSCEEVVKLFVEVSRNLRAFYAHAFVERNWSTYRGLSGTPETEQYPLPIGHEWFGIPPAPTWLHWLGHPYVSLVQESLKNVDHSTTEEGIFIRRGATPMDLDQFHGVKLSFPPGLLAQAIEDAWFRQNLDAGIIGVDLLNSFRH